MCLSDAARVETASVGHEEVGGDLHDLILDPPHQREDHLPEAAQPHERNAYTEGTSGLYEGDSAGYAGAKQKPWHRAPQSTGRYAHPTGESARGVDPLLYSEDLPLLDHDQDSRRVQKGGKKC